MKKQIVALALVLLMTLSVVAGCSPTAPAQTAPAESAAADAPARSEVLTLRWGATGTGSDDDNQWISNGPIIAQIEEKTNGMIKFEYYPSSQLGAESSMLDQVLMGTLDICVVNPNTATSVWPELVLMNYPFAYPDLNVFFDTWESPELRAAVKQLVAAGGAAEYLGISTAGYRGCQNAKRPIRSVADMKGLTFRTMAGQIYVDLFGAMGAATASVSASEVFTAIQQGLVDGEETAASFCYDNGYYEAEKYATELNAVMSTAQIIISSETWAKLSAAEKDIFREACETISRGAQTSFYNGKIDYYYGKLQEVGMEVIRWDDLSADEQQSFVKAVMPIWDDYKKTIDADFFGLWKNACAAAWEKNGYEWTYAG